MRAAAGAASGITLYTDGACKGNPGPGGWGVLIVDAGAEEELFGGERDTTNNRMELTAVIRGLEHIPPGRDVDVWTDSQYVKNGIETWIHGWKRNGWKTADKKPVKNAELWRALETAALRHRVRWHWVRGHNAHVENERADALANRGVDAVRTLRPG
ncbi:MAG TPA: ribonuclease HI [Casimicrobiaceae bacterium]|jgi:ribonuclease HI|nr:ribonuclease HI [Casimicrobiaceae bacterium]